MKRFDNKELTAVTGVVRSGKLSRFFQNFNGGEHVQAFEKEFAAYLGTKHAISVCNGTVSLELILKALKIGNGDKVITTPLSFVATATAILSVGAVPVFADIDPETLCIDPGAIDEIINDTGRLTWGPVKAILPVSLLGYPASMNEINEMAAEQGIYVIEDAAQALGAEYCGKKIGSLGLAGSFSLQESKSITSGGEGGMIVTDDDELANRLRHVRNHGNVYGDLMDEFVCTNARMTEMQAAFGRVQLKKLDDFNRIQRVNAEYFLNYLPGKKLSPVYRYTAIHHMEVVNPSYLLIPVYAPDTETRNRVVNGLIKEGISKGLPGQNVGYYKQLICEPKIMQTHQISKLTGQKCTNAINARDKLIMFDLHRWTHTIDDMEKYLNLIARLL